MRIPALVAVAMSAVLLSGCSGAGDPAAEAGGPTVEGVAAAASQQGEKPADTALAEDTGAICAQAGRTSTEFGKTLAEDRQLLVKAAAESKESKVKAQEKVTRDLENFSFALLDMSKLAADPSVKSALGAMGDRIAALKGDIAKIDEKTLTEMHSVLDKACGR